MEIRDEIFERLKRKSMREYPEKIRILIETQCDYLLERIENEIRKKALSENSNGGYDAEIDEAIEKVMLEVFADEDGVAYVDRVEAAVAESCEEARDESCEEAIEESCVEEVEEEL